MVSEFNSWKELWYITLSIAPPPSKRSSGQHFRHIAILLQNTTALRSKFLEDDTPPPPFPTVEKIALID